MVRICLTGSLGDIGFVSIYAKHGGKWVFCYHRRRQSWECPGGHVEPGEEPLSAARRELFEETGASEFDIVPVWDFQALNGDGTVHNNGRAYYAEIRALSPLPDQSEMERVGFYPAPPEPVTYNRRDMENDLVRAEKYASAFYR